MIRRLERLKNTPLPQNPINPITLKQRTFLGATKIFIDFGLLYSSEL